MRSPSLFLLLLLFVLAAGCLEPGYTPLGTEVVETEVPEDAVKVQWLGASAMGIEPVHREERIPLFETEMLFCGFDPVTSFRAEPIWVFDPTDKLDDFDGEVELAWLQLNFPTHNDSVPQDGDNPSLADSIMVRLWHLPSTPEESDILDAPLDLSGATQVPLYEIATETENHDPFRLQISGEGFILPPDTLLAWIQAGERVSLALEWAEGSGDEGMVRIYSRRSTTLPGDEATTALLRIQDGTDTRYTTGAVIDGMGASRLDPALPPEDRMILATGLPRRVQLRLDSETLDPDSILRDPDLMIVRAILEFWPDTGQVDLPAPLFGLNPDDWQNNEVSGIPADENGLTLSLRAAEDGGGDDWEALAEGDLLENKLAVCDESPYELPPYILRSPLILPLTELIQDWANGEVTELTLNLMLNGEEERLRQVGWFLQDVGDSLLMPRLEIIYARRPDFD